jgi:hypothetical protein
VVHDQPRALGVDVHEAVAGRQGLGRPVFDVSERVAPGIDGDLAVDADELLAEASSSHRLSPNHPQRSGTTDDRRHELRLPSHPHDRGLIPHEWGSQVLRWG